MKRSVLTVCVCITILLIGCSSSKNNKEQKSKVKEKKEEVKMEEKVENLEKFKDMTKVLIKTSMGDITIALYDETPLHKENFIKLANEKFYDGTLFHRIIQGFMIQTGDPNSKDAKQGQQLGNGGPGYTIPAEIIPGLIHKRGAVAAARQADQVNPKRESSGSQFYIVDGRAFSYEEIAMFEARGMKLTPEQKETYNTIGGAPHLDLQYTVFGEVISGMDIVDKIAAQAKDRMDRPINDIKIIEAVVVE